MPLAVWIEEVPDILVLLAMSVLAAILLRGALTHNESKLKAELRRPIGSGRFTGRALAALPTPALRVMYGGLAVLLVVYGTSRVT